MKPLVSILVHTRNSEKTIRQHLKSIKNQSYKPIEIILVDNNSTDNTVTIASSFTKNIYRFGPERSAQRNYAAKKATGDYFLIPDSDMILGRDVIKKCIELIAENSDIKAIIIPEKSAGEGFWAKCKALERSFYIGLSWMEGARFFKRDVFLEMKGYDEQNTGTEDYDLPQRIRRKYGERSIGRIDEYIVHYEGRLSFWRSIEKKFYYARTLKVYQQSNDEYFKKQANIFLRFKIFLSQPRKLFQDPFLGLGLLCMKTGEIAAWGAGYFLQKIIYRKSIL